MKALSIKEPYASMIYSGMKTIETRTWRTNYRGKLLLCASKKPHTNLSGNAFAIAEIIDCKPMTVEDEEKACCEIYPGAYSWVLDNVQKIKPFPVKGQLSFFEVDIETERLKTSEKIICITVTCRDHRGIEEERTSCIDLGSEIRITNYQGSKISYGNDFLKIGKCKIPIESHNTFGGSWCAEDFYLKKSDSIKLLKHLKKIKTWDLEDSTVEFEKYWTKKLI